MVFIKEFKIYVNFCEKNEYEAQNFVREFSEQKLQVCCLVITYWRKIDQTEVACWKLHILVAYFKCR